MFLLLVACTSAIDDTGAYVSALYQDADKWVCRPDKAGTVCDGDLDATAVHADGTLELLPHVAAEDPAFDCFYVYPTTSMDLTPNADWEPGEEEPFTVLNQAARYSSHCRVFAPLYRQGTIPSLLADPNPADYELAFSDVQDAWQHYLAQDNDGRGVLLIGHSQGAGMLRRLLAERIELDPSEHELLVAAHLIGAPVDTLAGSDTGGDLALTPTCAGPDGFGCVVSYLSFPQDNLPNEDFVFERPEAEQSLTCTHPGALDGQAAPLRGVFPTSMPASVDSMIRGDSSPWAEPDAAPAIDTPFFTLPDFTTGQCTDAGGVQVLAVSVQADPDDPRRDDMAGETLLDGWGLHLVDMNLAMDDLVELAGRQGEAWLSR